MTTRRFTVQRGATRVVFGAGAADAIGDELAAIGAQRVVVVCTPGRKDAAAAITNALGPRAAGVIAIAKEHVPASIVAEARAQLENRSHDVLLAIGGGSAVGLAKALALEGRARVAAVPTTYSGSEMTPIFGTPTARRRRLDATNARDLRSWSTIHRSSRRCRATSRSRACGTRPRTRSRRSGRRPPIAAARSPPKNRCV
jgi:maleylacetate reductase